MKVNPLKLKKIIQKSSFNYRLQGTRILFETDKITSNMVSPNNSYAILIDFPNDVLTGVRQKNGVELNFDLNNKKFSRRIFHQFDSEECDAKISKTHLIITDGNLEARFGQSKFEQIILMDSLPDFKSSIETIVEIDRELIKKVMALCQTASKTKINTISFKIEKEKPYLFMEKEFVAETALELNCLMKGKTKNPVSMSFNRVDLKVVFGLIKSEKKKDYKINFVYDEDQNAGYASIFSNDATEQYILYSKRESTSEAPMVIKSKFESTPSIPEKWDYYESKRNIKAFTYKLNNLTKEIYSELWIAREILSKSKSEAAKIMHGTLVPWMTWTQYCEDIGSSRQVINRWLKQAFESNLLEDGNALSLSDEFLKSAKKVVGKGKKNIIDAYKGRKAPEQIEKLMSDIESGVTKEAIVHVNSNYTYREWFKPLFDGYICFAHGDKQGSCFAYFGDKKDKFISEFSKHGVVMAKVE